MRRVRPLSGWSWSAGAGSAALTGTVRLSGVTGSVGPVNGVLERFEPSEARQLAEMLLEAAKAAEKGVSE